MMSGNLKFDKMDVDTTLAMKYIKDNVAEFHGIGTDGTGGYISDSANNKIYLTKSKNEPSSVTLSNKSEYLSLLWKLSEKIKCNIDLFCQLEYVIRRRSPHATKLDLEMVIKNLCNADLVSSCWTSVNANRVLPMKNNSPLIDLGWIAELQVTQIFAAENTAVVCGLFTKLCNEVGLKINLHLDKDENIKSFTNKNYKALRGCIGVVTSKSDIASAVDIIVSAPISDVWGFRRILVQESVRETFKQAMAWKSKSGRDASVHDELKRSCSDVYAYDDKVYVHEYVKGDSPGNVIFIECFRTVKEVIGMVKDYSPFCVSLWSSDVSESNEVAFGITAPLVWINGYGAIGGPLRISEAYYSNVPELFTSAPDVDEMRELQKTWTKLTRQERVKKICKAYKLITLPKEADNVKELKAKLGSSEPSDKNFVHVGSGTIVTGIRLPRDICVLLLNENTNFQEFFKDFLENLIDGSGYLVSIPESNPSKDDIDILITHLSLSDIPVRVLEDLRQQNLPCYTRRIIHANFGTIFAN